MLSILIMANIFIYIISLILSLIVSDSYVFFKSKLAVMFLYIYSVYKELFFFCREEEKKNGTVTGTDGEDSQEENEKRLSRLPKKRFEWNETIR